MKCRATWGLAAFVSSSALFSPPALGQTDPSAAPPEAQTEDAARAEAEARRSEALLAGRSAMTLYRKGAFEEAYGSFREADELFHTPQLVLYMARCQDKRGKLLEARALYERVLAEPLPDLPSESLSRARQSAASELGAVRLRVPTLAVDVRGPSPSEVTLFVDGEVFPLAEPRELDPGPHEVEALSRSGARTTRDVTLPEGRSISIVLRLGLFATGASRAAEPTPSDAIEPRVVYRIAAGSAFSISAVGLVVGAVTGGLAIGQKSVVEAQCIHAACSDTGIEAANRAASYASWSNGGFSVAALGALAGGAFVLFAPKAQPRSALGVSVSFSTGAAAASFGSSF